MVQSSPWVGSICLSQLGILVSMLLSRNHTIQCFTYQRELLVQLPVPLTCYEPLCKLEYQIYSGTWKTSTYNCYTKYSCYQWGACLPCQPLITGAYSFSLSLICTMSTSPRQVTCLAYLRLLMDFYSLPPEMLMECLKWLPIADLVQLLVVSTAVRTLALREITIQVDSALKKWIHDVGRFRELLKVRTGNHNMLILCWRSYGRLTLP